MKKRSNFLLGKTPKVILAILGIAIVVLIVILAVLKIGGFGADTLTINKIDGASVVNGATSAPVSSTPTIKGNAQPNLLVSIYNQKLEDTSVIPQISKATGENDLTLTYQDIIPPATHQQILSDDFNTDTLNNLWEDISQSTRPPASIYLNNGVLILDSGTSVGGIGGMSSANFRAKVFSDPNTQAQPMWAEAAVTVRENNSPNTAWGFDLNNGCYGGPNNPCQNHAASFRINEMGTITYDATSSDNPNEGVHGAFQGSSIPINQPVKLRIDSGNGNIQFRVDMNNNGSYADPNDLDSGLIPFAIWASQTSLDFYANQSGNGGRIVIGLDSIDSNLNVTVLDSPGSPAGYHMTRTGMELNGVSYMDDLGAIDPNAAGVPGVLGIGPKGPVFLPGVIPESMMQKDLYVFLVSINLGGTVLHTTWYVAGIPAEFAPIITNLGIPTTTEAFAKVATLSNGQYTVLPLPITSEGSITSDGTILPPGKILVETLIASATSGSNGAYTAVFGKDENGLVLSGLEGKTLVDLGSAPYAIVAKSNGNQNVKVTVNELITPVVLKTIDGQVITGDAVDITSPTPVITGTAKANTQVFIYDQVQTGGIVPTFTLASNETLMPFDKSSGFSDNFNDPDIFKMFWFISPINEPGDATGSTYLENGSVIQDFTQKSAVNQGEGVPGISLDSKKIFDFNPMSTWLEADLAVIEDPTHSAMSHLVLDARSNNPGGGSRIEIGINNTPDPANMDKATFAINFNNAQGSSMGGDQIPNNNVKVPIFGNPSVRLRIEVTNNILTGRVDTNKDGTYDVTLGPVDISSYNLFSDSNHDMEFWIYTTSLVPSAHVKVAWDNLASSIPLSGFTFPSIGTTFNGISYADDISAVAGGGTTPIPGTLWTGSQNMVMLPGFINGNDFKNNYSDWGNQYPDPQDIYAYLITANLGTDYHITMYDTKPPEVFAQLVIAAFGGAFKVDAYGKALTYVNGSYVPATGSIQSLGSIAADGTITPVGGSITETLIASAMSDVSGNWSATVNQPLTSLHASPYKLVTKAGTVQSLSLTINLINNTDTIAPVTMANITGTTEDSPYSMWYKNQATVTLIATDDKSGVAKTEYSLSGATTLGLTAYTVPIVITNKGETTVSYKSTDKSGNIETASTLVVRIDKDSDNDSLYDNFDKCPTASGPAEFDGCPNAVKIPGDLHIVYSGKDSGYAGIENGKQKNSTKIALKPGAVGDSRGEMVDSVMAKVYTLSALQTKLGTKDFDKNLKAQCSSIFDSTSGIAEKGLTGSPASVGVPKADNYVLAVRTSISDPIDNTVRSATVCRKIDSGKFNTTTKIAEQKIKFMKTVKNNCNSKDPKKICVQFDPADETVLSGSYLSITAPEEARWEEGVTNYIYPYIFESDSEWTLDVCSYAPNGYKITGVYDENGAFTLSTECTQALVSGTMKVVAFNIVDVGSPKTFDVTTKFNIKHKGKTQKLEKKIGSKVKKSSELVKKKINLRDMKLNGLKKNNVKLDLNSLGAKKKESSKPSVTKKVVDYLKKIF